MSGNRTLRLRTAAPTYGVSLAVLALSACTVSRAPVDLPLREAPPFAAGGIADVPERWWTALGDAAVDRQIERALETNLSLLVTWERVQEAEKIARRTHAGRSPLLDASAGGSSVDDAFAGESETVVDTALRANWEIDLWGRIGALVDADSFHAAASLEDYRAAALALSAEVATTWYRLAEARMQRAILDEQIATNQTILELQRVRFGAGLIRSADVLRQEALLEATRAQRVDHVVRIELLHHALATLLGHAPQAQEEIEAQLIELPPLPATTLPANLVRRRPDIRAALLRVEAADRETAAALAARYPRLTLSGSLSTSDQGARGLFSDWLAQLATELVAPLFDGGERRAEVERSRAVARRRLAEYGVVVLGAFREVEDALASERLQRETLAHLDTRIDLAKKTYRQLKIQYLNGVVGYLAVLDALTEEQELVRERLTARLELLELRIALYRALAGGFETTRRERSAHPGESL